MRRLLTTTESNEGSLCIAGDVRPIQEQSQAYVRAFVQRELGLVLRETQRRDSGCQWKLDGGLGVTLLGRHDTRRFSRRRA